MAVRTAVCALWVALTPLAALPPLFDFVCKDFLGYPRQESHFVWFPHLCSTRENLRLKKTERFAKSHTAAGTASPPVSEPGCPLDKVIDPRE